MLSAVVVAALSASALALPSPPTLLARQGAVTVLSSSQVASFTPYSFYASAAYCKPSTTINWSCGTNCQGANPAFEPVASGGDGAVEQFWYVGYDPTLNTVVVAHQGTDVEDIIPDLTDIDIILTPLDQSVFPGTTGAAVHNGFLDAQQLSAPSVLSAVQKALASHSSASVTLTGHSLGAAISLVDAVYLPLHLPSSTKFKYVGYGLPRVGNPAFASYLDAHFADLSHVNNKEDPVPIIPGRFLGFEHPHGEVHIQDSGAWDSCAGDDNTDKRCIVGDEPTILTGNPNDHDGPYNGVTMGC